MKAQVVVALLLASTGHAQLRAEGTATATAQYYSGHNDLSFEFRDPDTNEAGLDNYLAPVLDSAYPSYYLEAAGELHWTPGGRLRLRLDSGELSRTTSYVTDEETGEYVATEVWLSNGQFIEDEWAQTRFNRELHLDQAIGPVTVYVGKRESAVGYSLVFADYSPTLGARLDIAPFTAEAGVVWPERGFELGESVLTHASGAWTAGGGGTLSAFVARLDDGEDDLGQLTGDLVREATLVARLERGADDPDVRADGTPTSKGTIHWLGAGYDGTFGAHTLWARGVYGWGRADATSAVGVRPRRGRDRRQRRAELTIELDISGWAADAGYEHAASDTWTLGAYGLALSGSDGLGNVAQLLREGRQDGTARETLGAFISVVPYITYTSIFFSGGLDQSFAGRQASLGGLAARGVAATGVYSTVTLARQLDHTAAVSLLRAMADGPHGDGRLYGVELDNALTWRLPGGFSVSAQADVMRTGDFLPKQRWIAQLTGQASWTGSASR